MKHRISEQNIQTSPSEGWGKLRVYFNWSRIAFSLKLSLGFLLIIGLIWSVGIQQLEANLQKLDAGGSILFVICFGALAFYQSAILGYIISPFAHIPYLRLFAINYLGRFFSLFLPSSVGGDLIKSFYLLPYFPRRSFAYAAIFMHRTIGALITIAVALLSCVIASPKSLQIPATVLLVLAAVAAVIFFIIWKSLGLNLKEKVLEHKEKRLNSIIYQNLYALIEAVLAYRNHRQVVLNASVLTLISILTIPILYQILAKALGLELSYMQALVASTGALLLILIPITPGGVGVSEGGFVLLAGVMGVPHEDGVAIAIVARLANYVCIAPAGILYTFLPLKAKGS